jgi:hypothetical protein
MAPQGDKEDHEQSIKDDAVDALQVAALRRNEGLRATEQRFLI